MGAFLSELFRAKIYKRTQGKISRQATFYALAVVLGFGVYRMSAILLSSKEFNMKAPICSAVFLGGCWVFYRLVNFPLFADFLIAVQAEMNKVSWPSRKELKRATIVVLVVMLLLAGVIFLFDIILKIIAVKMGILG